MSNEQVTLLAPGPAQSRGPARTAWPPPRARRPAGPALHPAADGFRPRKAPPALGQTSLGQESDSVSLVGIGGLVCDGSDLPLYQRFKIRFRLTGLQASDFRFTRYQSFKSQPIQTRRNNPKVPIPSVHLLFVPRNKETKTYFQ